MTPGRILLLVLAALACAHTARATELPVQGNGRGSPFRVVCVPGAGASAAYMVGFSGYSGGWIDRFWIYCADWLPDRQHLANYHADPKVTVGQSNGGGLNVPYCPDGFISSITFRDTKGDGPTPVIHHIDFQCVTATLAERQLMTFGSRDSEAKATFASRCPRGEVAIGLHGRFGSFVDALGLICGPVPALAPPPQAKVPDGPPLVPIPSTRPSPIGAAPHAPSPAPRLSNIDQGFTGTWDTRTDKGWRYTITIVQDGRAATGRYVAQNGDKGRISGRVGANVMEFTWEQDGGFKGTGRFALAPDGNSFTGIYQSEPHRDLTDPRFLQGSWSGTRK